MAISTPRVRDETTIILQEESESISPSNSSQARLSAKEASEEAEEDLPTFIEHIIEALRERNIGLTIDVVTYLGIERSKQFLRQTLKIEKRGGMAVNNGLRRRTPGGIFFYLVKQNLVLEELEKLFPYMPPRVLTSEELREQRRTLRMSKKDKLRQQVSEAWESRIEAIKELLKSGEVGELNNMRVTLIGRPGKLRTQPSFVMTTMPAPERAPSLPREFPKPPESKLVYLVCIGKKQWQKVEKAIRNPEDLLIIEGYLTYEKNLKKMAVFAQMVTTKFMQQEQREAQKVKSEQEKAAQNKRN